MKEGGFLPTVHIGWRAPSHNGYGNPDASAAQVQDGLTVAGIMSGRPGDEALLKALECPREDKKRGRLYAHLVPSIAIHTLIRSATQG